jgi:hypothetical protein
MRHHFRRPQAMFLIRAHCSIVTVGWDAQYASSNKEVLQQHKILKNLLLA